MKAQITLLGLAALPCLVLAADVTGMYYTDGDLGPFGVKPGR